MKKTLKHTKGFDIVNVTIWLIVVGILLLVAFSNLNVFKNVAKMTGVEANVRTITAVVQKDIINYKASEGSLLEAELLNIFNTDDVINPFTKSGTISEVASIGTTGTAIAYSTTDNTLSAVTSTWEVATANNDLRGAVLVCAYPNPDNSDSLQVTIYPYDQNGKVVKSKKVIINP